MSIILALQRQRQEVGELKAHPGFVEGEGGKLLMKSRLKTGTCQAHFSVSTKLSLSQEYFVSSSFCLPVLRDWVGNWFYVIEPTKVMSVSAAVRSVPKKGT